MDRAKLKLILRALPIMFRAKASINKDFAHHLKARNCVVQITVKGGSVAQFYEFNNGKIKTAAKMHPKPDMVMLFKDVETGARLMTPPVDYAEMIHAGKNFRVMLIGDDEIVAWFALLANKLESSSWDYGERMPDGSMRYTQMTNGGPLHVYVKDGKILRTSIIEFTDDDAPSWSIEARGKTFTPLRKACVAPHALALKNNVYASNRILTPLKRVDFNPDGERNPQNRGKSDYVPISWDEALDIVSKEIIRQKQTHGRGSIAVAHPSHHQWGNINYYLSALMRFGNAIGVTRVVLNPDSWEGWYWGAMHHHGNSFRAGGTTGYGTLIDAMEECEQIVYWAADPESQLGGYAGTEPSQRRLWAKDLGIKNIHINPHYCPTAALTGGKWIPIIPGTDTALAMSLMHVWITEDTYDHHFVENRSTGFDEWKAYILGEVDGIAKTPEWQEQETGIPAHNARALAREWAKKKTYLACGMTGTGFGGACRNPSGIQWARSMVMLMAMQGWGKPGVNFGHLTAGAPVELEFYFPGYAEGGISGELNATGSASNNYVRMPHLISMNPVVQVIPRQLLPDAIINGHAEGYLFDPLDIERQMYPVGYPVPGYSKVHMLYRYGASSFGTIAGSDRFVKMYQSSELECVVSQAIWMEGETKFADIILPACTQFERFDIGEWCNSGGFGLHGQSQLNHRVITMQHKCIEPLGESKSDYQIFWDICKRLGLGAYYSEGCSELDWCKRVFESSDLPRRISWKKFLKKGYYITPAAPPAKRPNVDMRWFYEGRPKDLPEPFPLPGSYSDKFLHGLQTQSGKFEFVPSSLKRIVPENDERPALLRYTKPFEGARAGERYQSYPMQLITPHPRFSFHTSQDGKSNSLGDIEEHRILIDGRYYWILRINAEDAAARGIKQHDRVRVYNERGSVICAADVTSRIHKGVVSAYESCAVYEPTGEPGQIVDLGGCLNILTPPRMQAKGTVASAASLCLCDVERWEPSANYSEAAE